MTAANPFIFFVFFLFLVTLSFIKTNLFEIDHFHDEQGKRAVVQCSVHMTK